MIIAVLFQSNIGAFAQMFLEESKITLTVKPKETLTGSLKVHNTSDQSILIKGYGEDFLYQPPFDGAKKFLPAGTTPSSCISWINFSPQEFTLPPYSKKEVNYVIHVPPDIQPGGYYGVLFFEKQEAKAKGKTGVRVITRVGSLIFLETKDKVKKATVNNFSMTGDKLKGEFTNQGNVILIPQATFYIMNQEGMVIDRGELNKFYLPPGEKKEFQLSFIKSLPFGPYTAVLTFDLQEGNVIVKEIDFEKKTASHFNVLKTRD